MKITVDQQAFARALTAAARTAAKRTHMLIPGLSGALLRAVRADGGRLEITSTDLEMWGRYTINAKVDVPGEIVLPADRITELVRRMPAGDIFVTVGDKAATIVFGATECTIQGIGVEFPVIPEVTGTEPSRVDRKALQRMLRQVEFTVGSTEDHKNPASGLHLQLTPPGEDGPGGVLLEATDTLRVCTRRGDADVNGEAIDAIIPERAVSELERLIGESDDDTLLVRVAENHASFACDDRVLTTRLRDGRYPNIQGIISRIEFPTRARLNRAELLEKCERALVIARDNDNVGRFEVGLGLTVEAKAPGVGRICETLAADVTGPEVVIGLNLRFLIDGLRVMDSDEVALDLVDGRTMVRLQPVGDEDYDYRVMPVILNPTKAEDYRVKEG